MNKHKWLPAILFLCGLYSQLFSQNCGTVTDFNANITNNNNGTYTYLFQVTIQATSGGSKGVRLTIQCPNNTFVNNICEASQSTTRIVELGPYTVAACTGDIQLIWSGWTNAACGGTNCNVQQAMNLPVELTKFTVAPQKEKIALAWETASEVNNEKFEIERSQNGHSFEKIGEVAGNGTVLGAIEYQFIDEKPLNGIGYYRLKQLDYDGSFDYGPIKSVLFFESGKEAKVYPTLVTDKLNIYLPEASNWESGASAYIYNMEGALLQRVNIGSVPEQAIELSALRTGPYLLELRSNTASQKVRFIKL